MDQRDLISMDTLSPRERSRVMSKVKSSGAKSTEEAFARLLRASGITGWRRRIRMKGKPDFVFPKERIAVFVDGCFWHGCPEHCRMPSTNVDYWNRKIERNKQRDMRVSRELRNMGWAVFRFWEHDLRDEAKLARKMGRLKKRILEIRSPSC